MFALVRQNCRWRDRGKAEGRPIDVGLRQAAKRLGIIDDVSFARGHERLVSALTMWERSASWSRFLNDARENLPILNAPALSRRKRHPSLSPSNCTIDRA